MYCPQTATKKVEIPSNVLKYCYNPATSKTLKSLKKEESCMDQSLRSIIQNTRRLVFFGGADLVIGRSIGEVLGELADLVPLYGIIGEKSNSNNE
jgi:hypothetical protein